MNSEDIIARLRENDSTLQKVWIRSEAELSRACAAVQDSSNARNVRIDSTRINANRATVISTALAKMAQLDYFDMSKCDCSDIEALKILLSSLANKDSLHTLTLWSCNIDDRGTEAIAASFERNDALQHLDLQNNGITDTGAVAVASLIARNGSLTHLYLDQNNIGTEGAIALAHSITQNQTLKVLEVRYEDFVDDIESVFKASLYNNGWIDSVLYGSNHTLTDLAPAKGVLRTLVALNKFGPEKARRLKIAYFLNEKPLSLLSMGLDETLMPMVLSKIGRVCQLGAMFEFVRSIPHILVK